MSKYQPAYNQAKSKEIRIMVPEINDEIKELEASKRSVSDPDVKKAMEARIKALKIKKKSYKTGDPVKEANVEEEAQGAVTTGSIGVPTMGDGEGGTVPAIYGSSHIAVKRGKNKKMMSRKGDINSTDKDKKKKCDKRKKTCKEFVDFYFED